MSWHKNIHCHHFGRTEKGGTRGAPISHSGSSADDQLTKRFKGASSCSDGLVSFDGCRAEPFGAAVPFAAGVAVGRTPALLLLALPPLLDIRLVREDEELLNLCFSFSNMFSERSFRGRRKLVGGRDEQRISSSDS